MNDVAIIITGIVQLLFTGGIFLWLIKKIANFGERLAGLESVFEYIRSDHDRIIRAEYMQEKQAKDLNECYARLRDVETRSNH